jgi:DNA-binding response OmpR family regulator
MPVNHGAEHTHQLIVYELGRRWVDALRARAHGTGTQIRHCAGSEDTLEVLQKAPVSTLLIELGHDPLSSLDLLERASWCTRDVAIIAVARADQHHLELITRELGAIAFLREPVTGIELSTTVASIAESQWNRFQKYG